MEGERVLGIPTYCSHDDDDDGDVDDVDGVDDDGADSKEEEGDNEGVWC